MFHPRKLRRYKLFGVDDVLIGAAVSGLGTMFTNSTNRENTAANNAANIAMQRETNQMSLEEAQRNRDYQERLSNSAYQRSMADMSKAGLNPILAYQKGGASSPSGGQAALTSPKGEAPPQTHDPFSAGLNSAMALKRNTLETANTYATNFNIQADTQMKDAQRARTEAETAVIAEELGPAQLRNIQSKLDNIYGNSAARVNRSAGQAAQDTTRWSNPVLSTAKGAADLFNPFQKGTGGVKHLPEEWRLAPRNGLSAPPGKIPTAYSRDNPYQDATFANRFKGW